jgi:argininosuccinate lyase
VDTLAATLRIMAEMVGGIVVKPEAMRRAAQKGFATATDLADYLVKKDVPFRDAHEVVAAAVKLGLQQGKDLSELPLDVLRGFHQSIGDDVYESALTLKASLDARKVAGGTAPERVREQIAAHRQRLG